MKIIKDLNRQTSKSLLFFLLPFLFGLLFLLFLRFGGGDIDFLFQLLESIHGNFGGGCYTGRKLESATCEGDFTAVTFPDSAGYSFHAGLID